MKHLNIACLVLVSLVSCKKEEPLIEDKYKMYDGSLVAEKNGKKWNPKSLAITDNLIFSINIVDFHDDMEWDKASIGSIPINKGTYTLEDYRIWKYFDSTNAIADDAVKAYYNGSFGHGADVSHSNFLRKDRPHYITVNSYNPESKIINCTFSMSFIMDSTGYPKGKIIDTVSYTNATFIGKVWHQDELPK